MPKLGSMLSDRPSAEGPLQPEFEALSVSKRLVRSISRKLWKQNHNSEGNEEEIGRGISLRCLTLYGRGGGCKVGAAETGEDFGDPNSSRRSSTSEEGKVVYKTMCGDKGIGVDCFLYGRKEKFWKRNSKRDLELDDTQGNSRMNFSLPDDILELCLMRLPLTSLMNARLVCKKWNSLTKTPRFMQMRREGLYQTPWLFLFGAVKHGYCSGEIHVLDVSLDRWHKLNAEILKGRFLFSVASIWDEIFVVGGCSSLSNLGRIDRSSFKTHKSMVAFSPSTKSWRAVASMKYARSSPVLGISEVTTDIPVIHCQSSSARQDRWHFARSRPPVGVSDVYEDPHRLSVRRQLRNTFYENDVLWPPDRKQDKSFGPKTNGSCKGKDSVRFLLVAVGGLGSWDEPLDSGEIYDSLTNRWVEIPKLPGDFGIACSGVLCDGVFFVYSAVAKLAGYDVERGYWFGIHTAPSPSHVHEYYPKLVSCNNRVFMLSVSWCEGVGQIGRRNKAIRKMWELDLACLTWIEVTTHPDAPMDWNDAFVADKNLIFGVEMFKIFGQVLDFFTACDVSHKDVQWSRISTNHVAHELDACSCMTKRMAVLHL
ncbi:hypothetical protein Nepgr_020741 [Nepenthes gracilis]|uniref:F-box domain-containing protein n=1 Tax=Nepenthes gracilis TaxID=150966 RepID=A0AAD3XWJ5_NEPGR|nr:hypothetical protein Nepgr_020741 [Nepenthes gracilis]